MAKKIKKKEWIYIFGVAILCLAGMGAALLFGGKGKAAPVEDYIAEITIREYGTITLELDGSAAPITVKNFVKLAESGFYEGSTFHRIIEGFMMQGGASANGDSAKPIQGEFYANGIENPLSHTRGAISMARANDPNSANSQFFICHKDSLHLDGKYAAFGYVTKGIEVVDAICESANPIDNNGTILKGAQPIIESIKVKKA